MRRLVAISGKTSKTIMALLAISILLSSIHMAAAARVASLRRQQDRLEQGTTQPAAGQASFSNSITAASSAPAARIQGAAALDRQTPRLEQAAQPDAALGVADGAPARKRQIVISIPDRKLALLEDGRLLKAYPIAVGARGTPSPDGDFVVVNHARDPVYRHKDKEIAPGKDNPLGSRWMGLSLKGYGIHGTNVQSSVGKAVSHGCFRMRKQDVEELYALVQVGDTVTVRRERDALIAQVFAAPAAAPETTLAAKSPASAEAQVASATVTAVETSQE
jgi:lipoprotein-anchoring transpeptidase ErfK/SrfK